MTIVDELSNSLSVEPERLKNYISTCPYRYKVYKIPKRNGKGFRIIAQPAKELKFIQKAILAQKLSKLPVHDSCMAYKKNTNIRENALRHINKKYLLKMDFKDFFPSIRPSDLIQHVKKYLDWDVSDADKTTLKKVFFYLSERGGPLRLSVGAPTSPFLSNTLLYEFDSKVSELCEEKGICYTRYADDISFSTNKKGLLFDFAKSIETILNQCQYPKLKLNREKTAFLSRKGNMHITGLVLTNEGAISIGRSKKRQIKTLVYKHTQGLLNDDEKSYLSGYLSFCWSVEPDFIHRLEKKYGNQVISELRGKQSQ